MKDIKPLPFFTVVALALSGCSAESQVIGHWQQQNGAASIVFRKDNTYQLSSGPNGAYGRWTIEDGNLFMTLGDSGTPFQVDLDGNQLVMGSGNSEIIYEKD